MTVNKDGTKTVSYTYGGVTTTKTIDNNGKVISEKTAPYAKESYKTDDGVIVTQESPLSVTVKKPAGKLTTYTFNDGQEYTGKETNWEDAAKKAGNTSGLSGAISYPDYVDKNEAWRYLNEMADTYDVDIDKPVGNGTVYSKDEGVTIIPDYSTPFGKISYTGSPSGTGDIIYSGANGAGADNGSGYRGYLDSARTNAYKKTEADKENVDVYYGDLKEEEDDQYKKRQQEAYLSNYFASKKAQEALLEHGIKGGLSESSIIRSQADFENNYNDNLSEHIDHLRDIEAQRLKAYAEIEARLNEYFAEIDLKEAEMAREEAQSYNDLALKAYIEQMEKEEAARERAFEAQQAALDRQHEKELKLMGLK